MPFNIKRRDPVYYNSPSIVRIRETVSNDIASPNILELSKGRNLVVYGNIHSCSVLAKIDDRIGEVSIANLTVLENLNDVHEKSPARKSTGSKSAFPTVLVTGYKIFGYECKQMTVFYLKITSTVGSHQNSFMIAKTLVCFYGLKSELELNFGENSMPELPPHAPPYAMDVKNWASFQERAIREHILECTRRKHFIDSDAARKFYSTDRILFDENGELVEDSIWSLIRVWITRRFNPPSSGDDNDPTATIGNDNVNMESEKEHQQKFSVLDGNSGTSLDSLESMSVLDVDDDEESLPEVGGTPRKNRLTTFMSLQAMAAEMAISTTGAAAANRKKAFVRGLSSNTNDAMDANDSEGGGTQDKQNNKRFSNIILGDLLMAEYDDLQSVDASKTALSDVAHLALAQYLERVPVMDIEPTLEEISIGSSGSKKKLSHSGVPPHVQSLSRIIHSRDKKHNIKYDNNFISGWDLPNELKDAPPPCRSHGGHLYPSILVEFELYSAEDMNKLIKSFILPSKRDPKGTVKKDTTNAAVKDKIARMTAVGEAWGKARMNLSQLAVLLEGLDRAHAGSDEKAQMVLLAIPRVSDMFLKDGTARPFPHMFSGVKVNISVEKRVRLCIQVMEATVVAEQMCRDVYKLCEEAILDVKRAQGLAKAVTIENIGVGLQNRSKRIEESSTEPLKMLIKQTQAKVEEANNKLALARNAADAAAATTDSLIAMGDIMGSTFMRGAGATCSTEETEKLVMVALQQLFELCDMAKAKALSAQILATTACPIIQKCTGEIEAVQLSLNRLRSTLANRLKKQWTKSRTNPTASQAGTTAGAASTTNSVAVSGPDKSFRESMRAPPNKKVSKQEELEAWRKDVAQSRSKNITKFREMTSMRLPKSAPRVPHPAEKSNKHLPVDINITNSTIVGLVLARASMIAEINRLKAAGDENISIGEIDEKKEGNNKKISNQSYDADDQTEEGGTNDDGTNNDTEERLVKDGVSANGVVHLQWATRRYAIREELPTNQMGTRKKMGRKDIVMASG